MEITRVGPDSRVRKPWIQWRGSRLGTVAACRLKVFVKGKFSYCSKALWTSGVEFVDTWEWAAIFQSPHKVIQATILAWGNIFHFCDQRKRSVIRQPNAFQNWRGHIRPQCHSWLMSCRWHDRLGQWSSLMGGWGLAWPEAEGCFSTTLEGSKEGKAWILYLLQPVDAIFFWFTHKWASK